LSVSSQSVSRLASDGLRRSVKTASDWWLCPQ